MRQIWTHGAWTVKPGHEEEFVTASQAMARDALREFQPSAGRRLLQDQERSNIFRSFAAWDDLEQVDRFREFVQPRLQRFGELTEKMEVFTLEDVPLDG
ncbi:MAG: putative quinol monooxygenase [Gaiellaceae bacterium]